MTTSLANDLRECVVLAIRDGASCRAAAALLGVSVSSGVKWLQRHRATGSLAPSRMGNHGKLVLDAHRDFIIGWLNQTSHLSLHGLKVRWRTWQAGLDPGRLVFINETWSKTNMARSGAGARKVLACLRGFAPHGHWCTRTFPGALRLEGLTAPCVFDGPINGQCFTACVEQQLVPIR